MKDLDLWLILGNNARERFESFKDYPDNWDVRGSRGLDIQSFETMKLFVAVFNNFNMEPSLFLTPNGNLQLAWEDKNGKIIEIEFYPDGFEYYLESTNEESGIKINGLSDLIDKINDLNEVNK